MLIGIPDPDHGRPTYKAMPWQSCAGDGSQEAAMATDVREPTVLVGSMAVMHRAS